jgi:hypothetical protein
VPDDNSIVIPITPIQRALLEEYHRPRTDGGADFTPEDCIVQFVTWQRLSCGPPDWKQFADAHGWPLALVETLKDSITPEQRASVVRLRAAQRKGGK